jgi:hypothetical protein
MSRGAVGDSRTYASHVPEKLSVVANMRIVVYFGQGRGAQVDLAIRLVLLGKQVCQIHRATRARPLTQVVYDRDERRTRARACVSARTHSPSARSRFCRPAIYLPTVKRPTNHNPRTKRTIVVAFYHP